MKNLMMVAGAIALTGCGGPETLEEALQANADHLNRNASALQTTQLKNTKVSASVEGDVLLVRMTNFPSGTRTFSANAARKLFRQKLCDIGMSRDVLEMGGKIRVELRSNYGKDLPPVQVARC